MNQSSVSEFIRKNNLSGSKIGIAVSGGADSVALFFVLLSQKNEFSLELSLIHVNYHLRGDESNGDAAFVQNLATEHSIPFYSFDADLSCRTSGIEEEARRCRYDFFARLRNEGLVDWIAVGHTKNDQAETVLFRLIRGTSLYGVGAMESVRNDGIIRPLLQESGESCRQWLRKQGKAWREDSSNAGDDYSRNLIRHKVIPVLAELNGSAVDHLVQFADHAREMHNAIINGGLEQLRKRNLFSSDLLFHFQRSEPLDPLGLAAVVQLLRERGCAVNSVHTATIQDTALRAGKTGLFPNGWRVYSSYKRLIFYKESPLPFQEKCWDSLYAFGDLREGALRAIRVDDMVARGGTCVSALQQLKKNGVPSLERSSIPVVAKGRVVILPDFL